MSYLDLLQLFHFLMAQPTVGIEIAGIDGVLPTLCQHKFF